MMQQIKMSAAALILALVSSVTQAASFDFRQFAGGYENSMVFTDGGITVTVTAPNASGKVSQVSKGLGNGSNGFNYLMGLGDELTFAFNQQVNIGSITSGANFSSGLFNLSYDDGAINDIASPIFGYTTTDLDITTSEFTVVGTNKYALISTLNNVSAVPLPAAAWLFGSALLALGGFGRRKASATTGAA